MDIVVFFFVLGVFARLGKSDLRLPQALYETLSVYLLLAIDLKGGVELHAQSLAAVLPQVVACVALGFATPFLLAPVIKRLGFDGVNAASIAAHYGSVSVVTFAVVLIHLQQRGIAVESHAALWVAVMEAPGIVAGIWLARRALLGGAASAPWQALAHEVFFGKSVLLLLGGLAIGAAMGKAGVASISPLFFDLFKGALALFLLELGLVAGDKVSEIRRFGLRLVVIGIGAPLALSLLGVAVAMALGLSLGGTAVLATLAASASYIAAPTALRVAVPQADAGLSITLALGISFTFNVVLGVPIYLWLAQTAHRLT